MGILHVTKKKVPEVLTRRLLQALKLRDNASLENLDGDLEKTFSAGEGGREGRREGGGGGVQKKCQIYLCACTHTHIRGAVSNSGPSYVRCQDDEPLCDPSVLSSLSDGRARPLHHCSGPCLLA